MASDIWLRTILIVRKETRCRHISYSFRLTARVLLYAPSHRKDSTYHSLCYTSRGALAGTRNSWMGPPHEGLIRRPITPWANIYHTMSMSNLHGDPSQTFTIPCLCQISMVTPAKHLPYHVYVKSPWWPQPNLYYTMSMSNLHGDPSQTFTIPCLYQISMVTPAKHLSYYVYIKSPWWPQPNIYHTMYISNLHGDQSQTFTITMPC